MKAYFLILCLLSIMPFARTQSDAGGHYGNKYVAPKAGGGRVVTYDTITSLDDLIKKLAKPWTFNDTGKGYWIGYTDDMYSIARFGDKAIERLTYFIDTSHSLNAKIGGLYTLHLIGINLDVIGRFIEDFENQNARNALLKYLDDSTLNETVAFLIKRDPWLSDIPKIMQYLSGAKGDCSNVLTALQRYKIDARPLEQTVTEDIFDKQIPVTSGDFSGLHSIDMLISFQKAYAPNFTIDIEITKTPEWQTAINAPTPEKPTIGKLSFSFVIDASRTFSYCDSKQSFDYTFKDHNIEVLGPKRARQIWLDWWDGLPQNEKDKFLLSNHIPFSSRR